MTVAATGHVVAVGGRFVAFPWPIREAVPYASGALVLLGPPVGIAAGASLARVDADGTVLWTAEPLLLPPDDDPYDAVSVDGGTITTTTASGSTVDIDPASGAVTSVTGDGSWTA